MQIRGCAPGDAMCKRMRGIQNRGDVMFVQKSAKPGLTTKTTLVRRQTRIRQDPATAGIGHHGVDAPVGQGACDLLRLTGSRQQQQGHARTFCRAALTPSMR